MRTNVIGTSTVSKWNGSSGGVLLVKLVMVTVWLQLVKDGSEDRLPRNITPLKGVLR